MTLADINRLTDELLRLSPKERASIASRLLYSLDEEPSSLSVKEVEERWIDEARRRLDSYERGESKGIPAQEVLQSVERKPG